MSVRRKVQRAVDWLRSRFSNKALILMYHQIADLSLDPWALGVTPANFADHLQVLRQETHPISLSQLVQAHETGNIPDRAVVITFDDGYVDNFQNAAPLLEAQGIPATIFITTGYTDQNREFWWDELARLLLLPEKLPAELTLTLGDKTHHWHLGAAAADSPSTHQPDRNGHPWDAPVSSRLGFYYAVWSQLRQLPDSQQQQALADIRAWTDDTSETRPDYRPMTVDELIRLEQDGLVTIGAHTVTHPNLSAHPPNFQQQELQRSKQTLEAWLNHPIPLFAYPFGDYAPATVPIARDVGFACACTTNPGTAWRGSDRFQLPRVGVENWTGEEFERRITQWFGGS